LDEVKGFGKEEPEAHEKKLKEMIFNSGLGEERRSSSRISQRISQNTSLQQQPQPNVDLYSMHPFGENS
jgi:hypothetical protein